MININLLASREERLERAKNATILLFSIVSIIAAIILYISYTINNSEVEAYSKENKRLSYEISAYRNLPEEHKQLKQNITNTLKQIDNQRYIYFERNKTIVLFNDIARYTPSSVYLSKIEMKGDEVLVSGETDDNNAISTYIKNLSRVQDISKPQLAKMVNKTEDDIAVAEFTLSFKILNKDKLVTGQD